ncbi:hypothetical protein MAQ5080_02364 [Marinomonas aquimarina]|uniref:Uncharacterized protein n=1 Tax=Marinomonas aquimarina TaxID=295068 RepID=A0A1A8THR3_9GAMM|nr:hypothetical protein MAQ5080_02364 [Marinomonas aquimarina]
MLLIGGQMSLLAYTAFTVLDFQCYQERAFILIEEVRRELLRRFQTEGVLYDEYIPIVKESLFDFYAAFERSEL